MDLDGDDTIPTFCILLIQRCVWLISLRLILCVITILYVLNPLCNVATFLGSCCWLVYGTVSLIDLACVYNISSVTPDCFSHDWITDHPKFWSGLCGKTPFHAKVPSPSCPYATMHTWPHET